MINVKRVWDENLKQFKRVTPYNIVNFSPNCMSARKDFHSSCGTQGYSSNSGNSGNSNGTIPSDLVSQLQIMQAEINNLNILIQNIKNEFDHTHPAFIKESLFLTQ
jgi:hypothetical protein